MSGLAVRIAAAALFVGALAVAIVVVGVLTVGEATFARLMISQGSTAADAQDMFDQSITSVVLVAAVAAVAAAIAGGVILAQRISRPVARVGAAARRLAQGEHGIRVPRQGPAELVSLADSFNQLAHELEQQERQRIELIENFAHELRTPLTNLLGYLHGMRDGVVEASPDVFDSLREEVERLHRLSLSLDALTDSGPMAQRAISVEMDLAQVIRAAVQLAAPSFELSGVRLAVDIPLRLPAVGVPDHVSQVLANLLQNAKRYTPRGGNVLVSARRARDTLLVSVANSGAEIGHRELERVFERFYRVDRSRDRATGGAGIGLAIVKQLVEQAGGRVGAESSGGSTRFWFSLPG